MSKYRIVLHLPGKEPIQGMRSHRSLKAVHEQLRKTAPAWRSVMPDVRFEIQERKP